MADMEAIHTYEGTDPHRRRTSLVSVPSPDHPTIRYVDVDGVRLRASVRGTGFPLLVLTGIGASLELSAPLELALNSHGVQTVALDAPGTGESTRYQRPRRMPGLARTVERTLDALGYDGVDVLGVSFGGVLAQQLAHQAPRRVRRLVLAATGGPVCPGSAACPGRRAPCWRSPRRARQSANTSSPSGAGMLAGDAAAGCGIRTPSVMISPTPPAAPRA